MCKNGLRSHCYKEDSFRLHASKLVILYTYSHLKKIKIGHHSGPASLVLFYFFLDRRLLKYREHLPIASSLPT